MSLGCGYPVLLMRLHRVTKSARQRQLSKSKQINQNMPFEDIWMGAILARSVARNITVINIGTLGLADSLSGAARRSLYYLRPSSLIWHETGTSGSKRPWRLQAVHTWAEGHACPPLQPREDANLVCGPAFYRSCASASWKLCDYRPPARCSTE
eukprot:6769775-Prymnesium_polylepis.1